MTYSFQCAHGGVVCGAHISGSTEQEVLEKAVAHARDKHHVDLTSSETLTRYAHGLIKHEER